MFTAKDKNHALAALFMKGCAAKSWSLSESESHPRERGQALKAVSPFFFSFSFF